MAADRGRRLRLVLLYDSFVTRMGGHARVMGKGLHCATQARCLVLAAPFARALLSPSHPLKEEGAGKTECRLAPMARCAQTNCATQAQRDNHRWAGNARPSLRSGWNGLCRALPGESNPIAPVDLRIADALGLLNKAHRRKTGRQIRAPGRHDFTVRKHHRSCARHARSRFPALRPLSRRRSLRPLPSGPRVVTIAIRPFPWAGVGDAYVNSEFR